MLRDLLSPTEDGQEGRTRGPVAGFMARSGGEREKLSIEKGVSDAAFAHEHSQAI